jgi:hypothetical protein
MQAQEQLRSPENWQDFESLCKKLWGEIWECPEIKKNGRKGQAQHGVDIYGIPSGEKKYYGIQCKGKDNYTDKNLTEAEIDDEIKKAKKFTPPLKKLYFTTTGVKDAKIEQYIREKNIENIENELFEVHLYSWEDIVDLIDENQETHNWYVNNQKYKSKKSISVTFGNDCEEIICKPKYRKVVTQYIVKIPSQHKRGTTSDLMNTPLPIIPRAPYLDPRNLYTALTPSYIQKETNLSYFEISIKLVNTGTEPIKNYKLILEFDDNINFIKSTNIEKYDPIRDGIIFSNNDFIIDKSKKTVTIEPQNNTLVSDDNYISDDIYLKALYTAKTIVIKWALLSEFFKDKGTLNIKLDPDIIVEPKNKYVTMESDVKEDEEEILEFIKKG